MPTRCCGLFLPCLSLTFSQKLLKTRGGPPTPAEYLFAQPWDLSYTLASKGPLLHGSQWMPETFHPSPSLAP